VHQVCLRFLLSSFFFHVWLFAPRAARLGADSTPSARPYEGIQFDRPPLRFELNEGQADPRIRFTARGSGGISLLTANSILFQVSRTAGNLQIETMLTSSAKTRIPGASNIRSLN
jgi:hypothetical protein